MENATKALLMAGGLLIAILVASFMIFVLRKAGQMTAEYDVQRSENELASFNGQFEVYDKRDNTFFDIITVANLAYDVNKKNGNDPNNSVSIRIVNKGATEYSILPNDNLPKNHFFEKEDVNKPKYMYDDDIIGEYTKIKDPNSENIQYFYKFNCTEVKYNDVTGKVKEMCFTIENN